jgi:hypothetical protein
MEVGRCTGKHAHSSADRHHDLAKGKEFIGQARYNNASFYFLEGSMGTFLLISICSQACSQCAISTLPLVKEMGDDKYALMPWSLALNH